MKLQFTKSFKSFVFIAVLLAFIYIFSATAFAADEQKLFNSPEDAAQALISACKNNDINALTDIFGQKYKTLIDTPDKIADNSFRQKFVELASEKISINDLPDGCKELVVGNIKWPFPVSLIKENNLWRFDSETGLQELASRLIGKNELSVIQFCKIYSLAQREYAKKDRSGSGIIEYAQKFKSSLDKKDGLYWPANIDKSEEKSPLGPLVSDSKYYKSKLLQKPFLGYYFKILNSQGKDAPGGAYNYIINGHMVAGFALAAFPAEYGSSGIMSFIVNQQGKVYQKDLGKNTAQIVKNMTIYNPDKTWTPVE